MRILPHRYFNEPLANNAIRMSTHRPLKLLLIDALGILRRVYEAVPEEPSIERAQSAVNSSIASLRKLLRTHQPTHGILAFDARGHTWRHDLYPADRADRKPMPDDLRAALPDFVKHAATVGVRSVTHPGVAADDMLAAAFFRWKVAFPRSAPIVASSDKVMGALISHGAQLWDHFRNTWIDDQWVLTKFGVPPSLLQDYLALTGDSTHGVPGVPGIGRKTAAQLLNAYQSLDGVLAAASSIAGRRGKSLCAQANMARLSRRLVSFRADIHLNATWKDFRLNNAPSEPTERIPTLVPMNP